MLDLAEFELPYGFQQDCRHCILGDPCERHRPDYGSDEPTEAEMASMRQAADWGGEFDFALSMNARVRLEADERGIVAPGY